MKIENIVNLNIIKQFPILFKYVKNVNEKDLDIYLSKENQNKYKQINWLYVSIEDYACLIGLNGNSVCAIDSEGILRSVCEEFQNIPYEFLRKNSQYTDNETLNELFEEENGLEESLINYEDFCKENNIILDKQGIYHDKNGKLFDKYFSK